MVTLHQLALPLSSSGSSWREKALDCITDSSHHSLSDQNTVEKLWRQFFSDPSQWWDHTTHKANPKFPDFKHKKTRVGLWITGRWNPSWVKAELERMAPESVPRSLYSWNAMLSGFVKSHREQEALDLFQQMQVEGIRPDSFTFARVLDACASLSSLQYGRRVHQQVIQSGCESDLFVGSTLVHMYMKCRSIEEACRVFNRLPSRSLVSWTAMLGGYVNCGQGQKALELYEKMKAEGVNLDPITFAMVLKACASLIALEEGKRVHSDVVKFGCETDALVSSSLVDMYAKCGSIEDAWRVFCRMRSPDLVSWTAMLSGCLKCKEELRGLKLFRQMQAAGIQPDCVAFVVVLNSCASLMALEEGRSIHLQIIQSGFESDASVANALVDMYAKCGSMENARAVFHKIRARDVVSWNTILAGCVNCEESQQALELYQQMQSEGVKPDPITLVAVLSACASVMALEVGRYVHTQVIQGGYECDVYLGNALLDMYAKCGSIGDSWRVFHRMPTRNVVSWTAMLGALAMHGNGNEAVHLFEEMCQAGVEINDVTFVCLLSACSHAGLVDEGLRYFNTMTLVYGISPTVKHFACVVDLLGRAGHLDEAQRMLKAKPEMYGDSVVLKALLGASRNHSNVEMGNVWHDSLAVWLVMCCYGISMPLLASGTA